MPDTQPDMQECQETTWTRRRFLVALITSAVVAGVKIPGIPAADRMVEAAPALIASAVAAGVKIPGLPSTWVALTVPTTTSSSSTPTSGSPWSL